MRARIDVVPGDVVAGGARLVVTVGPLATMHDVGVLYDRPTWDAGAACSRHLPTLTLGAIVAIDANGWSLVVTSCGVGWTRLGEHEVVDP